MATAALAMAGLAACGTSSGSSSGGDGGTTSLADGGTGGAQFVITIQNMAFSPTNLAAPPGATVTVINLDSPIQHSVTSESAVGQFVPGAVNGVSFDTGIFTGTATFTLPANAPVGTVVPYFCRNHLAAMANSGQVTVGAPSGSSNQPDGGTGGTTTPPNGTSFPHF